tara:strand:+ start:43 stop:300 length:258 start_codon:yes stop_codon:yes gene_type:complete
MQKKYRQVSMEGYNNLMSKKIWIVQQFRADVTEYEIVADSQDEARKKFKDGDYEISNEYSLDGIGDTWAELEINLDDKESKKKLH